MKAAGAVGTAIYSANRFMIAKDAPGATVEQMAGHFQDADLILLEGGKFSSYPKIEVVRSEISPSSVCDPATLLALCTDGNCRVEGVPVFSPTDHEGLAARIVEFMHRSCGD